MANINSIRKVVFPYGKQMMTGYEVSYACGRTSLRMENELTYPQLSYIRTHSGQAPERNKYRNSVEEVVFS